MSDFTMEHHEHHEYFPQDLPGKTGGGVAVSEGAAIVSEGAAIVSEGAAIVSEGATIVSEGAAIVSEGAAVVSERTAAVPEQGSREERPLVSVSCITYNHGKYIEQAIESFLNQDCPFPVEILIHDDASTDNTPEIIRSYAEKYPSVIRPMLQTENQYSRGKRNVSGLFNFPRARGKYIAMCEGDDYWSDPKKLARQTAVLEADPTLSMCVHGASVVSEDGALRTSGRIRPYKGSRRLTAAEVISKPVNFPTASLLFRTEYAKSLPSWYFDCPVGDIPLQLFMLEKGDVYYMDEIMSVYRAGSAGSWSASMDGDASFRAWEAHYLKMKEMYEAFDRETGGRYSRDVKDALARTRFGIDLKEGNPQAVRNPENRGFLRELPAVERGLLSLRAASPGLYGALQKGVRYLRGQ